MTRIPDSPPVRVPVADVDRCDRTRVGEVEVVKPSVPIVAIDQFEGEAPVAQSLTALFESWGLGRELNLERLRREHAVTVPLTDPSTAGPDIRGVGLAQSFATQANLRADPRVLPILHEGSGHTFAASAFAVGLGYRPFITGALTKPRNPELSERVTTATLKMISSYSNFDYQSPVPADGSPPFLVVSDLHHSLYEMNLPSPAELKARGITTVKVGLENEDPGRHGIDVYVSLGDPAQRVLAQQLKAYEAHGIAVEVYGLEEQPRGAIDEQNRPFGVFRRILFNDRGIPADDFDRLWGSGTRVEIQQKQSDYLDTVVARFRDHGPGYAAYLERIEQARREIFAEPTPVTP